MGEVIRSKYVVVGGGIGGLATALGLSKLGGEVSVLEQAPEFGEVGAGLQLAPNAMAVLDYLGVLDAVKAKAVFPKRLVLKDARTGEELADLDLGRPFVERYGYHYIVTHRADLLDALLDGCRQKNNIKLYNNKRVVKVENLGTEARVECADGSSFIGEVVIGADGLHSVTRKLVSDDEPVCSEYVAYRGTIPMNDMKAQIHEDDVVMYIGPYMHFVQYPVRNKQLFNQVAVFRSFRYKPNSDDWGTPEELDECFSTCVEHVRHAASYMFRGRRWPMYDREPIENWTQGRVTLLGDAAHAMLQYMAQGACQALEDVAYLTVMLANHNDVENALQKYQKERQPRTAEVQRSVRLWGDFLHAADKLSLIMRDRILKKHSPHDYEDVDWLYAYRKWQEFE